MKQVPKPVPTLPLSELKESVRKEIVMLNNIERFLRRVRDISGDEAEYFVEAKTYIKTKVAAIYHEEVFRLQALKDLEKVKKPEPTENPVEPDSDLEDSLGGEESK